MNLREPRGSEVKKIRKEVGVGPKFEDISLDVYLFHELPKIELVFLK